MTALLRDFRFAMRTLAKNPGFTLAAIFTLALGIGANTGIFTVTNALLLRPFPYRDPERLVSVEVTDKMATAQPATILRYEMLRDHNKSFESIAAFTTDNLNLTGRGEPAQVPVARVSPDFFSMLGVPPQLGRSFTEEEGRPEGQPVAMLSDAMWRGHFSAAQDIVGQTVNLDGTPHTIVGVLPANVEFPFVGPADIWTPRYFEFSLMTAQQLRRGVGYLTYIARLRRGTTIASANSELSVLNGQYREQNPTVPDAGADKAMKLESLRDLVVADLRSRVWLLSGAVALVLLIACANVASLLLSRSLARRREIAVRTALGASRAIVVRQLLTESIFLSLIAGLLGVGLGWAATHALLRWGADQLPQGMPIGIDVRVLLFTLAISLLTGIIFGMFPAFQLSRVDLNGTLRDEGRGTSAGHARARLSSLLVVGQVALSLLLLIGAGLLLRSFGRLLRIDPGFDAGNVLTMDISLPSAKYAKPQQQIDFFSETVRRVSELAGVRSAAVSAALPLNPIRFTPVLPEGQPDAPLAQRPFVDIEAVSPQWFQTMRVPLRGGRDFTAADNADAPKVVVINESFARRFWPNQNPLGKHVAVGRWPQPAEVIGVAADIRNKSLAQPAQEQLYLAFPQLPWGNMHLLVRTAVPPQTMTSAVRAQIAAVDPDQPVTKIQTVDDLIDSSRAEPRFTMLLIAGFSVLALGLAVIGIYGVLAYSVAQRRQELGIRLALGAKREEILLMVVRQGVTVAVAGVALGLIAALLMTRLMASMLYEIGAYDPATFVLTPLVIVVIATLASYLPARRATKVDPIQALREN